MMDPRFYAFALLLLAMFCVPPALAAGSVFWFWSSLPVTRNTRRTAGKVWLVIAIAFAVWWIGLILFFPWQPMRLA